ncbi:MAG: helix-turn-helix transcriptional regulator [Flavobacteriales bacterium]|nr:helix-turn-helix transcriptional regulator [Flavobacteriales bacterium]
MRRRRSAVHSPPEPEWCSGLNEGERVPARIGQRRRTLREQRGWSQGQLAQNARIAQATVSRMEAGKKIPRLTTLVIVATSLGTTLNDLLPPVRR